MVGVFSGRQQRRIQFFKLVADTVYMKITILFLLAIGTLSSCASIIQPGPDKFMVDSNPKGATVFIDGQPVGQTPVMAYCSRSSECSIRIEKEGYQSFYMDKDKVLAGWFIGNLVLGGVIGGTIDLIGHNQGKYTEDPIYMQLAPSEKPVSQSVPSSQPAK